MTDIEKRDSVVADHDLLIEINTKLGILLDQFHEHKEKAVAEISRIDSIKADKEDVSKVRQGLNEKFNDHELRIRRIERYVWLAIGALALLQFILK